MNRNDRNEWVLSKMLGTNVIKSGYKGLECGKPLENDDLIMIECKVTDNGLLDKVKSYLAYDEDDDTVLQLGNVYLDFAFDIETGDFGACNVVDTKSSTWELYPEEIGEIFGKDFLNYKKSNFIDSGIEMLRSGRKNAPKGKQIKSAKDNDSVLNKLNDAWNLLHNVKIELRKQKNQNKDAEIYYNDLDRIKQELGDFIDEFEKNPV